MSKKTDVEGREVIYVPLNESAKTLMERVRFETGVPRTEAVARILEWFASLDRKLRLAVLNKDEETKRELVRLVLEQMAKDIAPATFTDVVDEGEDIGKARDRRINERVSQELQRPLSVGVIPPPPKKPAKR